MLYFVIFSTIGFNCIRLEIHRSLSEIFYYEMSLNVLFLFEIKIEITNYD